MTPLRLIEHLKSIMWHPLTEDRPLEALGRYVRWQIGSRLVPGPTIVPFTNRGWLVVTHGMHGATCCIYTGLHDFSEMSFTAHLLRPGDIFGDVGANVGTYTVLAGSVAGAACISYEPADDTFKHLERNVTVNHIRAKLIKAAVGAEEGEVKFTVGKDATNRVAFDTDQSVAVPVVTLDQTCKNPTLLKIDVEGFELQVLEGARQTLRSPTLLAVIMETNGSGSRYGSDNNQVMSTMLNYGFEPASYDPFTRKLGPPCPGRDAILIRDVERVSQRLRTSPHFEVFGRTI